MLEKLKEGLLWCVSTAENILCSPPLFSLFLIWLSQRRMYLFGIVRHSQSAPGNNMKAMKFSCQKSDLDHAIMCCSLCAFLCCRWSIQCSSCLSFIRSFSTSLHFICHLRASRPCCRLVVVLSWLLWAVWNEFQGNVFDNKLPQCWFHWLNKSLDQRDHRESAFTDNNRSRAIDNSKQFHINCPKKLCFFLSDPSKKQNGVIIWSVNRNAMTLALCSVFSRNVSTLCNESQHSRRFHWCSYPNS